MDVQTTGAWILQTVSLWGIHASWLTVMASAAVFLCLCSVFLCYLSWYSTRRQNRLLQEQCVQLRRDLQVSNSAALGMGQRIMDMEKKLIQTQERFKRLVQVTRDNINSRTPKAPAAKVARSPSEIAKPTMRVQRERLQSEVKKPVVTATITKQVAPKATEKQKVASVATNNQPRTLVRGGDTSKEKSSATAAIKKNQHQSSNLNQTSKNTDNYAAVAKPVNSKVQLTSASTPIPKTSATEKVSARRGQSVPPTPTPTTKKRPLKHSEPAKKLMSSATVSNIFDRANQLLKAGVAQDLVSARCGLSKSEVALMAMVLKKTCEPA